MDDGKVHVFEGYRVVHNTILGPSKGGIRYDKNVNLDEVKAPGRLDDLEVRRGGHPLRRGQGWHYLRPHHHERGRNRAPHPRLHRCP
ncbi:MAG: Glu/Leu/Phe/Val dehydrogenase dimerization domain-containing protein [Hymenobacter sp.]